MALRESTFELRLGNPAPDFQLPDPEGKLHSLQNLKGEKATLIAFWCNHCPYVKHIREPFLRLCREFTPLGLGVILINSNDSEKYPDDSPRKMQEEIRTYGYDIPYLVDETQDIAKAYFAACTPDFFLFDQHLDLSYAGQMDQSRPGNEIPVTGKDLRQAITATLNQNPIEFRIYPSAGCNIKWKPGQNPDYF